MIDDHLTRNLFRSIHKGWRNPGDLAVIAMAHLFELCPRCRQEFESWRGELGEGVAVPDGQDFDAVLDRMRAPAAANDGDITALDVKVEAERKRARSRAEDLLALPAEQRLEWIRKEMGRHTGLVLAEVLIDECRRRTPSYPHEGVSLANLARVVLQHAPTSVYASELYARALASLANAVRVIGDLPRADQILSDSRYFLSAQGGGDPLVRAEIDSLEGSLRTGQYRLDQAVRVLLRALMRFRSEGRPRSIAVTLIKLARVHGRQGEFARSLKLLREAEKILEAQPDQRLLAYLRANRAATTFDAGETESALELLREARAVALSDDPIHALRLDWLEQSIYMAAGKPDAAAEGLLDLRGAFRERRMLYDEALVGFQLAKLRAKQGRRRRATAYVEESLSTFESLEVHHKVSEARELWRRLATS